VIKVKREVQGETLILKFSGEVIETVDFKTAVGTTQPDTVLNCKKISRLNSHGVKDWIAFFANETAQGTRLRFIECSPPVVEQINLIMNFVCGGTIESIYVPFCCQNCQKNSVCLYRIKDLRKADLNNLHAVCRHCQGKAVFDDIPDEYFLFFKRGIATD
jgi:hypothetical protein